MSKMPKVLVLLNKSRIADRLILRGIVRYSHLSNSLKILLLAPFYQQPGGKLRALSEVENQRVDGIIANIDSAQMNKSLIAAGLPAVMIPIKKRIPGFHLILDDKNTPGKTAAEYLLNLGLRKFAFCGFENLIWSQMRSEQFSKAIAAAGFQTHSYRLPRLKVQRLWENEQIILGDWLKSLPKPIGLMACNDDRAQYVLEACQMASLRVPDDVAVIGVDNDELICDLTTPPLSSIALNHEKAGYQAAQLLDKMMAGEKVDSKTTISLQSLHVVSRQSTDVLAIEDHDLVKAIRFIRQHSNKVIQVTDVVDHGVLSRRALERRFRKILRRSVFDEIKRTRVEHVCRMLLTTNLSVSQIALRMGYSNNKHIGRSFRREKGMTPLQYRKEFG